VRKNPTTAFIRRLKPKGSTAANRESQPLVESRRQKTGSEFPSEISDFEALLHARVWHDRFSIEGPLVAPVCGHPPGKDQTVRVIAGTASI
jgi:hypothetical protein